ncbi:MFS general substrate transporter [Piromyces finnis]|uniref:MFS general substrate transporter n=1 Tax=Piromyces finnis TaxID=1754191 RepID=A0A1Y1V5M2_9FUNG|nr:MFS general substrate transporter [Piromyces finnis]|eukprot:ORX47859.1 MFS general substrate transporter [Piromyces finnis]
MTSIELNNFQKNDKDVDIKSEGEAKPNPEIYIDVKTNESIDKTKEAYHEEYVIKKVGGGGPDEPKFIPMLITIISVLFFSTLNESVATVMYTDLVNEFGKSITTVQWVTTGFIIILAIGMIFSSFVAKHLYMRTIFFVGVAFFTGGSLICALSYTFAMLLIGRFIQGVGTALLMPQISNIVIIMAPRHRLGFFNGITMLVVITGNALGPTLSGLITRFLGWRYVFVLLIPIPLIGGIAGYWLMGNVVEQDESKLDIISVLLAIIGYGGISFGLGNTGTYGFGSLIVIISLVIGVICIILFYVWENYCKNPIVSMKNLGRPYFIINIFLSVVNSSSMMGWLAILPFIIQNYLGKSVSISGVSFLPGGLLNASLNVLAGKLFDSSRFKYAPIGFIFILLSSIFLFIMSITDNIKLWIIIITYAFFNIGIPIIFSIYTSSALTSVPPQSSPHAAAVYHSFFQLSGSLGSAVYVAILNTFTNVSFNSSNNPLINGASICFLVTSVINIFIFIAALYWSIYYFKDHDNKGNPKQKQK